MLSQNQTLPRLEDCIGKIGSAQYVSKIDLLKGYWQEPLTPVTKDIPEGFYQYIIISLCPCNISADDQLGSGEF